ncbi:MAG: STAS domain-containing protein [Mariprofundaceae bacterium]
MNSETEFMIREEKEGSESVCLYVQGDLDADTSSRLKRVMSSCFSSDLQRVQVVLDDVPRMDSSGVATLVEGLRWSRASGNSFVLSGLNNSIHDLFVLAKLENEFEIVSGSVKQ